MKMCSAAMLLILGLILGMMVSTASLANSPVSLADIVVERPLPVDGIPHFLDTDFVYAEPDAFLPLASNTSGLLLLTTLILLGFAAIIWRHQRRTHRLLRQVLGGDVGAKPVATASDDTSWEQRFARACEQLQDSAAAQRLQGLHLLESLAHDGGSATLRVVKALETFIKTVAPWPPTISVTAPSNTEKLDVTLALQMIGRIRRHHPDITIAVDLSRTDLSGVVIQKADFRGVKWHDTNLTGARFDACNFTRSEFWHANMAHAHFAGCMLAEATFLEVHHGAPLTAREKMARALLHNADFSTATGMTPAMLQQAHVTRSTKLPKHLHPLAESLTIVR